MDGLKTTDALQYAELDRAFWNSVVQRSIRTDLPPAVPGRAGRVFDVDDLVVLRTFSDLLAIGVQLNVAGFVADDLRAHLRADDAIDRLHLVIVREADGATMPRIMAEPPADATTLWIIDVAKGRGQVSAELADRTHAAEGRAVIAETVRRVLCERGTSPSQAGQVADRVHRYLEHAPDVEILYVSGSPPRVLHVPPENDCDALPLPVGEWRRDWLAELAAESGPDDAGAVH